MKFLTENIWESISKAASTDRKNYVAVAYFGTGGAELLPLKEGDVLVVDACDSSVRSGTTNPSELRKLIDVGVEVYSLPNLHSKVYLLDKNLFIGSSNVSLNSKNNLFEAVFQTDKLEDIEQAKKYILSLMYYPLSLLEIERLESIYKPPKWINFKGEEEKGEFVPRIYLMKMEERDFSQGYEFILKRGREKAKRNALPGEGLEEYEWLDIPKFTIGDIGLDLYSDLKWIEPPKRIVHIEFWEGTKKCFIFCKKSTKSKKKFSTNLKEILGSKPRQGFLSKEKSRKVLEYWNLTYNQL